MKFNLHYFVQYLSYFYIQVTMKLLVFPSLRFNLGLIQVLESLRKITMDTGNTRVEKDSFGDILVPADKYYGANTARSLIHFNIGGSNEKMPVAGCFNFKLRS